MGSLTYRPPILFGKIAPQFESVKFWIFYIFLKNYFAKLYDRLKFLQIWQPTAVRHGV
jgi:hypothetical protein